MLKIGEFSKLAQISVRMLRYYDQLDLLRPAAIDPTTAYRYYLPQQLTQARLIRSLQTMGFHLQEIKPLLADSSPAVLKPAIVKQLNLFQQQQVQLQQQITLLTEMLAKIEREEIPMTYEIIMKTIPQRQAACLRQIISRYNREGDLWHLLCQELTPQNPQFANPPLDMAIYHDQEFKERDVDVEIQTSIIGDYCDTEHIRIKQLPPVTVASVTFSGAYEQLSAVAQCAAEWIDANDYRINGTMFTIYHMGPHQSQDPANWLTECCLPIIAK